MKIAAIGATGKAADLIAKEAIEKSAMPEMESDGRKRFILKLNDELSGRIYHLVMDNGYEYVVSFLSDETLAWAKQGDFFVYQDYKCAGGNPQTYFVNFIITEDGVYTCISLVIDLENSLVTMVKGNFGIYPARSRLTTHQVIFGAIKLPGEPLPVIRHSYTAELVGKKIAWQYSPAVKLTHIYISERYMRSSLKNMPPIDENTTAEQKAEIEDRAKRWGAIFFEETSYYIKISKHLYLVGMIEDFRNRINPETGGGDMLYLLNTVQMQDFIRSFSISPAQVPEIRMFTALGEFIDEPDEMESAPSPFRI
jgi:hypothetical protein